MNEQSSNEFPPWESPEDDDFHSIHFGRYRAVCHPEAQERSRNVYIVTVYVNHHAVVTKKIKSLEKAKSMSEKVIAQYVVDDLPAWIRSSISSYTGDPLGD